MLFTRVTLLTLTIAAILHHLASAQDDQVRMIQRYHTLAEESPPEKSELALAYEDSALTIAQTIGNAEQIALTLSRIGTIHRRNLQYPKAVEYYNDAIKASPPSSPRLAEIYLEYGITLHRMTLPDSATSTLKQGLAIVHDHANKYLEASLYNMLGNVAREQNHYEEALDLYIKAIKLFEGINSLPGLTQALSNAGNILNLMGDTGKALEYAQESLKTAQQAGVKSSVAYSYRLLGRIYRKQSKPDDALDAYQRAVTLYQEILLRRDVGETQLNIGNIYFDKRDYTKALNEYVLALASLKSIPDTLLMTYAYSAAGSALLYLNRYDHAKGYVDSTLAIARKKKFSSLEMDSYQALSEIYEATGDYKISQSYYKKFIALRDSVTEVQNREAAKEIEARYQSEKKDDAIRLLNAENELKEIQQMYLLLLIALAIILVTILYSRYKIKLKANEKLKELDQIKSRFFTNVSHEFRTPLSLIIGPLEEKLNRMPEGEDKQRFLLMHRNARRLQHLVNQVLDLSKIEAGSMELHLEEGDLAAALRIIASTFSSLADRKGVTYHYNITSMEPTSVFDRDKIEKIITNLLSNAFKFTPEGGMVQLKAGVSNDMLKVEIKDSGVGISADRQEKIFQRFYQIDDSLTRTSEGSGIGLALSRELAELHKGTLVVTSTEDIGSIFTLTLPVTHKAFKGMPVQHDTSSHDNIFISSTGQEFTAVDDDETKPLVLVAEDNEDMLQFIHDLLCEHYRVAKASNGNAALERAQTIIPDLVISDWMMPGMDGRMFCEKLKNMDTTCHIPVLMLTARADQPSKIEGLTTGADDYLTKPFDTNELVVRVHNLIEQRKKLRLVFSQEIVLQPKQLTLPSRDAEFLSRVLALLDERYSDAQFSVEEMSQEVGMSRMQLHRKMKALTDYSPGDFLRRFRLERAKQLLAGHGLQVSEVCFKVGFNNVSNFSKLFREFTGMTPTEFVASSKREEVN